MDPASGGRRQRISAKPYSFSYQLSKEHGPQNQLIVLPIVEGESSRRSSSPTSGSSHDESSEETQTANIGKEGSAPLQDAYSEPSEAIYTSGPPRQFKFNRQPFYWYWYTTAGPSKLEEPPAFPDGFTLEQDTTFTHRTLGAPGPEALQIWWRGKDDPAWVSIRQGDVKQFHGKMYHLTVGSSGDVTWVLPDTYRKHYRPKVAVGKA